MTQIPTSRLKNWATTSWRKVTAGILNDLFALPAALIQIHGRMRRGKTDYALRLTEDALKLGFIDEAATNIHTDALKLIEDVGTAWDWLDRNEKPKVLILDEADSFLNPRRHMSTVANQLSDLLFQIGKMRGKIIAITHRSKDIDTRFRKYINTRIIKTSKTQAHLESKVPALDGAGVVGIPPTSFDFESYTMAKFEAMKEEEEERKEEKKQLKREKKLQKYKAIYYLDEETDLNHSEIAEKYDISRVRVTQILSGIREGKYDISKV